MSDKFNVDITNFIAVMSYKMCNNSIQFNYCLVTCCVNSQVANKKTAQRADTKNNGQITGHK